MVCLSLANVVAWRGGGPAVGAATSGAPACASKGVSISVVPGIPGMGHANLVVLVTDREPGACAVVGRPAIRFLARTGTVVGAATPSSAPGPVPPLVLQTGETAAALLSGSDRPIGAATSCATYPSYAVVATRSGAGKSIAGPLTDCAGLSVTRFVPGFNGTSASGRVSGRAPSCSPPPTSIAPGATVEVDAWSGRTLAASVNVAASTLTEEQYTLVLPPGRYRVTAHDGTSREVVVRAGRTTGVGLFGVCTLPPATVTTIPPAAGITPTTSTTLPASQLASIPRCTSSELAVSALHIGAAMGNVAEVIAFKNVAAGSCTLSGYPGVAALDARGVQVEQARRSLTAYLGGQDTGTAPMTVALQPGQVATATVDGSDNPIGVATSCPYYPSFLVTVPDETHSVVLGGVGWQGPTFAEQGFPGCSPIVVTPVVPGETGSYP
jgi:hypothetical protein